MRMRRLSGFAALVTAGALVIGVPGMAAADPGGGAPSANQVAAAKAQAAAKARQVGNLQARLAVADAQLAQVNALAELAVERYDKSQVDLGRAQAAAHVADAALARANQRVAAMQERIAEFARASYETGGLSAIGAFLNADGPATLLQGAATLNILARHQHEALVQMQDARRAQHVAAYGARVALTHQQQATAAVARAQEAAQQALASEQAKVAALTGEREQLQRELIAAEGHAAYLAQQRATYLAQQAAIAAAQRAAEQRRLAEQAARRQQSGSGSSGGSSTSGSGSTYSGGVSRSTRAEASIAVQWAWKEIGKPYQWGASGPDQFDCSGLTMYVWGKAGITLDHWTGYQWNEGAHESQGNLRPGDLVFFAYDTSDPNTIHHVGIYVGNGMMIDAPQTGEFVREEPAFRDDYIGAVRP